MNSDVLVQTLEWLFIFLSAHKKSDGILISRHSENPPTWSLSCQGASKGEGGLLVMSSSRLWEEWQVASLSFHFFVLTSGKILNHFGLCFLHNRRVITFTSLTGSLWGSHTDGKWGCPQLNLVWTFKGLSTESSDGGLSQFFCHNCSSQCWC